MSWDSAVNTSFAKEIWQIIKEGDDDPEISNDEIAQRVTDQVLLTYGLEKPPK